MKNNQEGDIFFAVYSRKSKVTERGESMENQAGLCREFIVSRYPRASEGAVFLYEDEGFSGGNTNRPQFRRMMKDAKEGKFSVIVCYRLDRVSRNIGDFTGLIEELERYGVSFVSIREQFDTESPLGRAMMYIASVFSQLERETIAERIRDNMLELAKTGRWLGGVTPTGYVSVTEEQASRGNGRKKCCKLQLLPREATSVRLIFDEYRKTGSLTKVETELIQNGVRTKNGKHYSRFAIRKILENPVYMAADETARRYFAEQGTEIYEKTQDFDGEHGIMAYNKTVQRSRKANKMRDMKEWIVAPGRHRSIISGEEWVRVQEMLGRGRTKAYRKPKSTAAVLSGLLFCSRCGSRLRPKLNGKAEEGKARSFSYLCQMKEKSRKKACKIQNPAGNELDQAALRAISGLSTDEKTWTEAMGRLRKRLKDSGEESRTEGLRRAIQANRREIDSLVAALGGTDNSPARRYITDTIDRLHDENRALLDTVKNLEREEGETLLSSGELEQAAAVLSSPEELMMKAGTAEQRAALGALLRKAVWDGERCHLFFAGAEVLIPGQTLEPGTAEGEKTASAPL